MTVSLEASYRHCQQIAQQSGSNFYCAFLSLPREMFQQMCVLYAFMRQTDDIGDAPGFLVEERHQQLSEWRQRLTDSLNGQAVDDPILMATAHLADTCQIDHSLLYGVIEGVQSDLTPRRFQTFDELEYYCLQVAGYVGLCCLAIWKYHGEEPRQAAVACGTAFQLTNVLRDLSEDLQRGRIYLPDEDLQRFGYSDADLRQGKMNAAFRELMQFEITRAKKYYVEAYPLLKQLSPAGQRIFSAFYELYGSLLQEIERANYDVLSQRIRLPKWKKGRVALRCLLRMKSSRPRNLVQQFESEFK